MTSMSRRASLTAAAAALVAATTFAGFAGTDLFLPMAGRQAGVHPSNWYTTVWIHNPGAEAATARVFFLQRGTANPAPPWVDVLVAPGDTQMLENVVETYFHLEAFGALRVTCDSQRLVVTSRVFSQAVGEDARDSVGQDFAGVPAVVRDRHRREVPGARRPPDPARGRLRVPLQLRLRRDHRPLRHRPRPRLRRERRRARRVHATSTSASCRSARWRSRTTSPPSPPRTSASSSR